MRKNSGSAGQCARRFAALVLVSLAMALVGAQSATKATTPQSTPAVTTTSPAPATSSASASIAAGLPTGFSDIALGMSRDEVIAKLMANPLFAWRGPEDVSLLSSPNQSLIEVAGLSFVRRAFFQFLDGKLWVIILNLAPDRIDHYSVFADLSAKYGDPVRLDPQAATWESASVRMALERPLTLRYLDLGVLGKLRDAGAARASVEELERRDFLGEL